MNDDQRVVRQRRDGALQLERGERFAGEDALEVFVVDVAAAEGTTPVAVDVNGELRVGSIAVLLVLFSTCRGG